MKTFKRHIKSKLKDKKFKEYFNEEKHLIEMSLKIIESRKHLGLSQQKLSKKAGITQQQLSKIENGINCNMITFLKVCHALGIKIRLARGRYKTA